MTFRDKSKGWLIHKATMVIEFANGKVINVNARKNNYFRAFLNDYISRPCCSACGYTFTNRVGDITIGDFWGIKDIDPSMFDDKGASVLLINNKSGNALWELVKDRFIYKDSDLALAFAKNHRAPCEYKRERMELFRKLDKKPVDDLLAIYNDLK
jgi:coenzyme F420-reducing hydrogenase beta subunit